jgi:MoaA/NifB/PqqE/SkfB family radical SAM enzyme
MIIMDNNYCPLPFNHTNIHPNGGVSICCVAKMDGPDSGFIRDNNKRIMNLKNDKLSDIYESASYSEIRNEMLDGKYPTACEGCYKIEKHGGKSRRQLELKRWGEYTEPKLEFIDLRLSNLCNLKCMMCYPDSSSLLSSDYTNWSSKLPFMSRNNSEYELFQWFNEDMVNQLEKHKDTLKYLYINGGEPFIMPIQWKLLEKLIDWGVAENIHISYNTNCTTYNESFSDYWKHFKVVTVGCSVDSVGDRNKFIRYPSKWDTTCDTIVKLANNPHIDGLNITNSIQWLNAPFLPEFYEWALPLTTLKDYTTINQNFVVFPNYLSLNCASLDFKNNLREMYINSKYSSEILTPTMESYLTTASHDDVIWNQGQSYLTEVSNTRGMGDWKTIFNYDYKY